MKPKLSYQRETRKDNHVPSSRLGFASLTYTSAASSITTFMNSSKPCKEAHQRHVQHD